MKTDSSFNLENVMHNYSIDDQIRIEKAIILASSKFAMCHDLINLLYCMLLELAVGCIFKVMKRIL
jgi:hypothetical protein